ncbi:MAG: type II toxin-antitoxin system VapC family toxin [Terriglobales bacterium]
MIIDTSALVALALREPEAERLAAAMVAAPICWAAAVSWLELRIVLESRMGPEAAAIAGELLARFEIRRLNFDETQVAAAFLAWQHYGKGRHPARLNLGDCCAYAASVTTGEPLLFKGNDFAQTDVEAAVW